MGRRGWDGGKHRSLGIPPIPPYQIPQAPKRYFAYSSRKPGIIVMEKCYTFDNNDFGFLQDYVKTRRGSPVDDRPSTDKLHHFVRKKKEKKITRDM